MILGLCIVFSLLWIIDSRSSKYGPVLEATSPTSHPTVFVAPPTFSPTRTPSRHPTRIPSFEITAVPTLIPTISPSIVPSVSPSVLPTKVPTNLPTVTPSQIPSETPTLSPSETPSFVPSAIPTVPPTNAPSKNPTAVPSETPSASPTHVPSCVPTETPSEIPSEIPTQIPSERPTETPSVVPTEIPSQIPTEVPTETPSYSPTDGPTLHPSHEPTARPTLEPTYSPTYSPTYCPTSQPSSIPSSVPSKQPYALPTTCPSRQPVSHPTSQPTDQPIAFPSSQPTRQPISHPSHQPTNQPTTKPSNQPTKQPSSQPSRQPTRIPTMQPSSQPSTNPTHQPTSQPSTKPTVQPVSKPSRQPTSQPTSFPSTQPTSFPSDVPSDWPTEFPTSWPSAQPTCQPSSNPSHMPTTQPSRQPSTFPSSHPSGQPSRSPTSQPTSNPSDTPSDVPSEYPTSFPTSQPSSNPTSWPTRQPTNFPSSQPSSSPTGQPTSFPSDIPSESPSEHPSSSPSSQPTSVPSTIPSVIPTRKPTMQPSSQPSSQPTSVPTTSRPTSQPSSVPSNFPSAQPSEQPSSHPSCQPSDQPTSQPTYQPSDQPSCQPSSRPTFYPTAQPSSVPSAQPSSFPSGRPTTPPSSFPSSQPSVVPSSQPSFQPSSQPSAAPSTFNSDRVFTCGKQLACESNNFLNCTFYTGNITLKCVALQSCEFQVGWFSVGPNTHINMEGNCALMVIATHAISIFNGSSITGPSIILESKTNIYVDGQLITDSLGAEIGAGTPANTAVGIGGSYGGNGGDPICNNHSFAGPFRQIGSIKIYPDLTYQYDTDNPAIGSGGGPGSRGGGLILLRGNYSVTLTQKAVISCRGSPAPSHSVGGGSGGSVTILTTNYSSSGIITVDGGNSQYRNSGAGGGGRISVSLVSDHSLPSHVLNSMYADGGTYDGTDSRSDGPSCVNGAPGTVYVEYSSHRVSTALSGTLIVRNSRGVEYQPVASTVVSELPVNIGRVFVTGFSTLVTKSLKLAEHKMCSKSGTVSKSCSSISIANSTLVCANVTSVNEFPEFDTECKLRADSIFFTKSQLLTSNNTAGKVFSKSFILYSLSKIILSSSLIINATDDVSLGGSVYQTPEQSQNVSFQVFSAANITLGDISVSSIVLSAQNILGNRVSMVATMSSVDPYRSFYFNSSFCGGTNYVPNSITLNVQKLLKLNESLIQASGIAMCAEDMHILDKTVVSTDGFGSLAGQGIGAGQTVPNSGGGGGGYGGNGGTGESPTLNGGNSFGSASVTSYGSGGGCYNNVSACSRGGTGGGYVTIRTNYLELHGNVSSNGANGAANGGGGSGGYVSMLFKTINGLGYVLASGGNGGNGMNPGGGGGGGYVVMTTYSAVRQDSSLSFDGLISTAGGLPGQVVAFGAGAGNFPAASGSPGVTDLPDCAPGYGNVASQGRICVPCEVGYYSTGGDGPCLVCSNKPPHAIYIENEWYNSLCPYQCQNGYTTSSCYDPFQEFLYDKIGLSGFVGSCVGFFALILIPLAFYRYKKYYDWGEKEKRNIDIFGKAFFYDTYDDGMGGRSGRQGTGVGRQNEVSIDSMFTAENPMFHHTSTANDFDEKGEAKWMRIRQITHKGGKDGRREIRMVDQDMIFHAYRINLMGSNEPFSSRGGPWKLPLRRPDCLKPTLLASEYYKFASEVNRLMEWNLFSVEIIAYYLVLLLTPPLSSYFLRQLRHMRTQRLLNVIAKYDHACFRCPIQRRQRNSLRVGVSPDSTLAYLDILFDETHFTTSCKPLCPLGQTKLPASFKFAGLGTYSTPYYVDTNDLLLQAVSQTDVANAFIDEAWVTFVYNLNIHLRTLQCDAIYMGARALMKFLDDPSNTKDLGGLVIQLCTFENEVAIDEDNEEDRIRTAKDRKEKRQQTIKQTAENKNLKMIEPNQEEESDIPRDTFNSVRASRGPKDNWFHHVGDLLHINPAVVKGQHETRVEERGSEVEIAMSDMSRRTIDPAGSSQNQAGVAATMSPSADALMNNAGESGKANATDVPIRAPSPLPASWSNRYCNCFSWLHLLILAWFDFCCPWWKPATKNWKKLPKGKILQSMDFIETCAAIRSGRLSMGVVVYHPKVLGDTYVLQPDDYASDLEDDEVLDETLPKEDSDDEMVNESKNDKSPNSNASSDSEDDDSAVGKRVNFGSSTIVPAPNSELSTSATGGSSMLKSYGSQAEKMAKFYKIMMEAEFGITGHGVSGQPMTPISFTPGSSMSISMKGTSFSEHVLSPSLFPFPMVSSRSTSFSGNPPIPSNRPLPQPISTSDAEKSSFSFSHKQRSSPEREGRSLASGRNKDMTEGYVEFSSRPRSKSKGMAGGSSSNRHEKDEEDKTRDRLPQSNSQQNPADAQDTNAPAPRVGTMRPVRSYSVFNPRGSFDSTEENEAENDSSLQHRRSEAYNNNDDEDASTDNNKRLGQQVKSTRIAGDVLKDIAEYGQNRGNDNEDNNSYRASPPTDESDRFPHTDRKSIDTSSVSYNARYSEISEGPFTRDTFDSGNDPYRHVQYRKKPTRVVKPRTKTAADLEAEHTLELRNLRRKRRNQARTLSKRNDLAPSCFQHPVRAWVHSNSKLQGAFSSGKLGGGSASSSDDAATSLATTSPLHAKHVDEELGLPKPNRATFDISSEATEEDDDSHRRSSVNSSEKTRRNKGSGGKNIQAPLETDNNEHFRDSILPASFFSRMTFTGKGTHETKGDGDTESSDGRASWSIFGGGNRMRQSLFGGSNTIDKVMKGGMTATEAISVQEYRRRQLQLQQSSSQEPMFWSDLMESFRARMRLAYINNFYFFFFTRFMVGTNIFPFGPSYIRRVIELILFLLSLSDCMLWVLILSTSLCVSNDITKCENHLAFNMMISLWPGAFIIAPIFGMIAIVLGPSSTLSRIYAMFSRLAGINNLILIVVVIKYSTYYLSISKFSIWPVVALTSGRLLQTFTVDLYIAHVEKLRYTRGWDGMHTSLFKTRDNKVVVN